MKKTALILCAALCAALFLAGLAEAKRVGGGSSFGSRSTYSRSYSKPTSPSQGYTQPGTAQPSPQVAQPAPSAPPPVAAPGMGSRLGWGLGGMLAGGLIGSMLFGHGGMGGGWGGGIGLMDILLIGLIIFFAVKLLRRRNAPPDAEQPQPPDDARSRAEQGWDALRSQPAAGAGSFGAGEPQQPAQPVVPAGFNTQEFLEGAKTVYARLQHSWDRRDLADIALFTTPEVHAEIARQAQADPSPSKTEILLVNASLLEFREEDRDTVVSVYFDVLMREDAAEERPKQVREVWHFSRPTGDANANWRLEGIQQMES